MTPERLDAIRERVAKATEGPWATHLVDDTTIVSDNCEIGTTCDSSNTERDDGYNIEYERMEADAAFIAAARQDIPDLLAALAAAKAENEALAADRDSIIRGAMLITQKLEFENAKLTAENARLRDDNERMMQTATRESSIADNEPCLSPSEQKAQASRCGCCGADDYCPCQNVPDRHTRAALTAIEAAGLCIVPREATTEMVLAALTQDGKGVWEAMVEAGRI